MSGRAAKFGLFAIGVIIGVLSAVAAGIIDGSPNGLAITASIAIATALFSPMASVFSAWRSAARIDAAKTRRNADLARAAIRDLTSSLAALKKEIEDANFHGSPENGPDLPPARLGAMIQCMDEVTSVAVDVPDLAAVVDAEIDVRLVRHIRADFRWAAKHLQFPADLSTKSDAAIRKWIVHRFFHFDATWQRLNEAIRHLKEAERSLSVEEDA